MTDKEKKYFDEYERVAKDQLQYHKTRYHEDLLQEAWEKFPAVVEGFSEDKGDFKGYASTTVYYQYLKFMKKQRYILNMNDTVSYNDTKIEYVDALVDYSDYFNHLNSTQELASFFNSLDGKEKKIMEDFYLRDMNIRKLIKEYNITQKTYKKLISNTDTNLFKMLDTLFTKKVKNENDLKVHTLETYLTLYHDVVEMLMDKQPFKNIKYVTEVNLPVIGMVKYALKNGKLYFGSKNTEPMDVQRYLEKHKDVVDQLKMEISINNISINTNKSIRTIRLVKYALENGKLKQHKWSTYKKNKK